MLTSRIWSRIRVSSAAQASVGSMKKMISSCATRFQTANNQAKIDVLNVRLNYEKVGEGSHPILCLPGALGSIETDFRPQLTHLNRKLFTVVCWDPPGYGKSRPPDRDFSQGKDMFYNDARLATALMKKLNFDKFSILGWSDGGITALILASLFPESVEKMVVWGGNAFIEKEDVEIYRKIQNVDSWSPKMKAPMIGGAQRSHILIEIYFNFCSLRHTMGSTILILVEMYGEDYFRKCWSDWVECCIGIHANGGDLCKSQISKITCPTLILHGKQDAVVPMYHPEYLHKNIKNSELVFWDEGKHNLHLRFYKDFNALVEAFLFKKS